VFGGCYTRTVPGKTLCCQDAKEKTRHNTLRFFQGSRFVSGAVVQTKTFENTK
jgi:hypothetical protein